MYGDLAMIMRAKHRFFFILLLLPITTLLHPPAVRALDKPHNEVFNCGICHTPSPDLSWWTDQGSSGGVCGQCHYPGSPIHDAQIHAVSPAYGNLVLRCTQCHNPHYQKQMRTWKSESYLATGTISDVSSTSLTRAESSPSWTQDQWKGMLLVPDIRYMQYNYRIASNTASVITIDISGGDAIKLGYAAQGAAFAVVYGGLLNESIGGYPVRFYRDTGANSFADGDAVRDGVCEVCHTRTTHFRRSGGAPDQLHESIGSSTAGTRCVSCHRHDGGFTGTDAGCIGCHDGTAGSRAAVGSRFRANSHHVQDDTLTNQHCYQCHWEANDDGSMNTTYHGGSSAPGSPVDLVIYGSGARPLSYNVGTSVQYTANGQRGELAKINTHCLGCHNDANLNTQPFGDGKKTSQYAWDGTSVDARYSQAATGGGVKWGKYTSTPNAAKKNINKEYTPHFRPDTNQRGWNPLTGVDGTITDAKTGTQPAVLCFDCHNSHGSGAPGVTASYDSATSSGGILKETTAGQGGYGVTYSPQPGGSAADKNLRNAGASLCIDCHLTQAGGTTTPWGYESTFGATQQILGYWDSPYLAPGGAVPGQRYPYKALNVNAGGHFGASSPISSTPTGTINGLCTPCHDPHGVTDNTAKIPALDKPYAVPLLRGTWLTSPYKEDVAPANNAAGTVRDTTYPLGWDNTPREGVQYHIDQNTFGANIRASVTGITQADTQFAGLCLTCHPKSSLTDGSIGGTWKSVDRIHESVKGWGANVKHNYTCSKCHTPHNGSALPRLMVTNCLDSSHKQRRAGNPSPVVSGSGNGNGDYDNTYCYGMSSTLGKCGSVEYAGAGSGSGRIPGTWSGYGLGTFTVACHENRTGSGTDQSWNVKTPWANNTPALITGPSANMGDQLALLRMDEPSWGGAAGEVKDGSGANNHGTASSATTVAGGISGRSGIFNGSNSAVQLAYSPPADDFTIEAWIKPAAVHGVDSESTTGINGNIGQRYVFGADHKGTVHSGAGVSAGTNGISVYEHGESYMPALAVYSGSLSASQWTHMAVVYSNKRPSIYVNGTLVRTGLQSPRAHVYAPTRIGGGTYGYFPGGIDEVAIYSRALTAAEVLMHYLRSSASVCNVSEPIITWTTDFDSTSYVDYGLTTSYGSTAGSASLVKDHNVSLSGLSLPGTYHYRVRSSNTNGGTVSGDRIFTLQACTEVPPILASPTAASVESSQANLGATIEADGGAAITARGTVWGPSPNPTGNPAAEGGTATGAFGHTRTGLTKGEKIYYRGYATNSAGTGYSPDGSFHTEPEFQASNVSFASVDADRMTVNWTRGSGDGVIVLMKQGSAVDAAPADGAYTSYIASTWFGVGTRIGTDNHVVYKGTGSSVTATGLNAETTYHVAVYEYKGTVDTSGADLGANYKSAPATGNQATTAIASGPHSFTFDYIGVAQSISIPAAATNIQFTVKGAGGGGGSQDNIMNHADGQPGHLVSLSSTTAGVTLTVYVGRGGQAAPTGSSTGAPGGWGYASGSNGGNGEDFDSECWAYGGAGGGGSSAILAGPTLLAEAAGGAGGRSSDYEEIDYCYNVAGLGGNGGGSDYYPGGTMNPAGGGAGGIKGYPPTSGGNGQVVITYDIP